MTEQQPEHDDGETGRILTLDAINAKLDKLADTVASMLGQAHGAAAEHEASKLDRPTRTAETTQQHATSLAAEIQSELAKLRAQEKSDADRAELIGKVAALKKATERAPREFRKVEHRMGWVTPDDR